LICLSSNLTLLFTKGGSKLERARDLFEQAVEKCPAKYAKELYLMYTKLEEEHGLARNVMRIFDRATRAVEEEQRYEVDHHSFPSLPFPSLPFPFLFLD